MNRIKTLFLFIPFIGMCCWAMYYAYFVKNATEVVLPITGYDPRNLLSGHYIDFRIDWSKANCYQAGWNGVCPMSDFRNATRFYVPENKARELERFINNNNFETSVIFAYQKGFRSVAKELLIEGQLWEEFIKNPTYKNKTCYSQSDCGGINSGYFCNSNGMHTPNKCEKTNPEKIVLNGIEFFYNKPNDLKSWCREAFESQEDRDNPGNCNWGYLSYDSAKSWCASIGKKLVPAYEIEQNCLQFAFLPKANPDQQYWTEGLTVVHMGQECAIQKMVRGDGYAWAGGVICN